MLFPFIAESNPLPDLECFYSKSMCDYKPIKILLKKLCDFLLKKEIILYIKTYSNLWGQVFKFQLYASQLPLINHALYIGEFRVISSHWFVSILIHCTFLFPFLATFWEYQPPFVIMWLIISNHIFPSQCDSWSCACLLYLLREYMINFFINAYH